MTVTGDRAAFLGRLRQRLVAEIPQNPAHPLPPPVEAVPTIGYGVVDLDDPVGTFVSTATAAGATVHRSDGPDVDPELLAELVDRHHVSSAVITTERVAASVGRALERLGVDVAAAPASPQQAAQADLGVTSAVALVAATGSVVLDTTAMRARSTSLLPPVHLCVAPASLVVRSPSEVLRPLTGRAERLPSNLIFVTGPSRTGDIEQLITIGVHGPTAVEIVITAE